MECFERSLCTKIGKSRDHKGVAILLVQKRFHPRGRDVPKTPVGRVLLRLTYFILPPPHPSVKESDPGGPIPTINLRADSYDQLGTTDFSEVLH
jgi:hypothetical protein